MANPNPKTDHLRATQFGPGISGNPGGRRSKPISEAHKRVANMTVKELYEKPKPGETVALRVAKDAAKKVIDTGDLPTLVELTNRVEGKPVKYRRGPQD